MSAKLRPLEKILSIKPEPQTTPALGPATRRESAVETVQTYKVTASLRSHLAKIFDTIVHRKGQGFWVQAEYGAGKTHFLAALIDLLVHRAEGVWDVLRDSQLRDDYASPLSKVKLFPVAFSLKGMGEAEGFDSLMRVLEEQVRESLLLHAPAIESEVKITSAELAAHWYKKDAGEDERAGVASFFAREHKVDPEQFLKEKGPKKFGQEIVRSRLAEGKLRGKIKERFALIHDQITKLGGFDGILFVIDEFRSWQDRHLPGTAAFAEDEDVLETLAFVLPSEGLNIVTVVASQGDMPQKLSGGGKGDRFIPLALLADKNKSDFGEIVVFRCRELVPGAATDVKDYYDHCRKEYRSIRQGNVSLDAFTSIFPFQPRCFDVLRRITQNAEQHNLPTARSAIRTAWQALAASEVLKGRRLLTLPDIIHTAELEKGLQSEHYRAAYQSLQAAAEQLTELGAEPDERDQAHRVLETLFLWCISLPDALRDGLTAQDVAEAAWLSDDALEATDKAEQLLERLVQGGFPVRVEKKTRDGKEVAVYSYELSSARESPVRHFAPLKKKAKEDTKAQDAKWLQGLFWGLEDLTPEAQQELGVNGGVLGDYAPSDARSEKERKEGKHPNYELPFHGRATTKRVHRIAYGGEVVVADRWKADLGKEIENTDEHFRIVYLTSAPDTSDAAITSDLKDARIAVVRPGPLSEDTREALAELLAAEQMKRICSAPTQSALREYADEKRRAALKLALKAQLDEYRRGKVLTQKGYGIPVLEIFKGSASREDDLAGRLLEKAYDTPLFSPKLLKKDLGDPDVRKLFAGLFHKDAAQAEKAAVQNFAVGLEVALKTHPNDFDLSTSQAAVKLRELIGSRDDIPLADLKGALCRPPYGLTDSMVVFYVLALVRTGGFELVLKPGSGVTLPDGKPIPGDRLTAHTVPVVDWNAKLDKALLGARLVVSAHKGWNDILPWARVLEPQLKPVTTPEEERARGEALLAAFAKLTEEIPEVEKGLGELAKLVPGQMPMDLRLAIGQLKGLVATTTPQEFEAAARSAYETPELLQAAIARYDAARKVKEQALSLSLLADYVARAGSVGEPVDFDRETVKATLQLPALLQNPSLVPVRLAELERWKSAYVHAYRKAHRAHYEQVRALSATLDTLRPRVKALLRMNEMVELGPPLPVTQGIKGSAAALEKSLWVCPDVDEAAVADQSAVCPKCQWQPSDTPLPNLEVLASAVEQGLADRFRRFKDATVHQALTAAADAGKQPGLQTLLQVIQLSDADRLSDVLTEELVAFLRKLLYDESLVDEEIALAPFIGEIGAIEENRVDEAVDALSRMVRNALKDAKAKHGPSKRVRVFLR